MDGGSARSMPKPTFLNLPPDKRARIVEHAIDEFSSRPYRQASLSRIVANAGIAKGSVYQYFDNKLDLYTWLLTDELPRRKMAAISAAAPNGGGLCDTLRSAFLAGFAFARAEPKLARMGGLFQRESADPELAAIVAANAAMSHAWMLQQVQTAQAAGEVRPELDADVVASLLVTTMGDGMLPLFARRIGVDVATWMANPELSDRLTDADIEAVVDSALAMLRGGLETP